MVNSWELALKAKLLKNNGNRLNILYVREDKASKKPRYKKTRSGQKQTVGITQLLNLCAQHNDMSQNLKKNLELLVEYRNSCVHFIKDKSLDDKVMYQIFAASVKNFQGVCYDWFEKDVSELAELAIPLGFASPFTESDLAMLSTEGKKFLKLVAEEMGGELADDHKYAVAIRCEVRFVKYRDVAAINVRMSNSPGAVQIQLSEEDIRQRYPWDYETLTKTCQSRYDDFKVNRLYHDVRRSLESDRRFCYERRLDPKKPKPVKRYYNPSIINELDKHYQRKR